MDSNAKFYAASVARQASTTADSGLIHLLGYAARATIAGSRASEIAAAEYEVVVAEYQRRGLELPFWAKEGTC